MNISDRYRRGTHLVRVCLLGAFVLLSACSSEPDTSVQTLTGATMGTQYHVSVVVPQNYKTDELHARIDTRLRAINDVASTYIRTSELSLLNQHVAQHDSGTNVSALISDELAELLVMANEVHEQSKGAFDITVAPLVDRWGFGPLESDKAPSDQEVAELKARVGQQALSLDDNTLTIKGVRQIDLSAVAKGWGVDQIAALLQEAQIENFLVEIGGELRVAGHKPDDEHWRIAIERPDSHVGERRAQLVMALEDLAIATSGDYRNYFEKGGQRFSHIINPNTGKPITHKVASVSVLHPSAALADAYATAILVLGEEDGMALAEDLDLPVYMIVRHKGEFIEKKSSPFDDLL